VTSSPGNKQEVVEELFGLPSRAIERWILVNRIDPESRPVQLVKAIADKLFFLANKSQEQISDEYGTISKQIAALSRAVEIEVG
jgi:hypothetical protein